MQPHPPADEPVLPPLVPAGDDVPRGRTRIEQLGMRAWSLVGIGLAVYGLFLLLGRLAWLVAPAVVALVMGVAAAPMVGALARRHIPRTAATGVVFVALIGIFGGAMWLVAPPFARQVSGLAVEVPSIAENLSDRLQDFETRVGRTSPAAGKAIREFRESLRDESRDVGRNLARNIFGVLGTTAGFVAAFLIGTVVAFLAVKDMASLTGSVRAWLERPQNARLRGAARSARRTVTAFVRHQLSLAVVVGGLETLLFWLVGLPYFVLLGVVAAVGNLVPGIGPVAAALPVAAVALAKGGPGLLVLAMAAVAVVKLADLYWFGPVIGGPATELPTLVQIVALIVGAGVLGLAGLIVAIPVAAIVRDGLHWLALPEGLVAAELDAPPPARSPRRRRGSDRGRVSGDRPRAEPAPGAAPAPVRTADPQAPWGVPAAPRRPASPRPDLGARDPQAPLPGVLPPPPAAGRGAPGAPRGGAAGGPAAFPRRGPRPPGAPPAPRPPRGGPAPPAPPPRGRPPPPGARPRGAGGPSGLSGRRPSSLPRAWAPHLWRR